MDNLIFSCNVVIPVFIVIGIGYFVKSIGLVDDKFINDAIKFNFRVGLSTLIFKNIYTAKISSVFDPKLLVFVFLCIVGTVVVLWLTVPLFVKDKRKASALIHTIYRSNFLLLGVPLATNMFGESNIGPICLLLPVAIPTYNFFAVLILASFDENNSGRGRIKSTIVNIIKNPLIIGSAAAILLQLFSIKIPAFLENSISCVASIGTPLALITLGAQFNFKKAIGNLKYSVAATIGRLIIVPGIVITLSIILGFRGYELGGIFILFSSPSAISSYIMAKEMHSDSELTGDVVVLTTLLSMFTIFGGVYLLKTFSLI